MAVRAEQNVILRYTDREGFPKAKHLSERQKPWCVCSPNLRLHFPVYSGNDKGKKVATKEKRWYKEIGLGFKMPSEAITGTYIGVQSVGPPME